MADPKKLDQVQTPAAEAREIPSFTKVATESRDSRATELADLAGARTDRKAGSTESTPAGGGESKTFDAFEFYKGLPEDQRSALDSLYFDNYNAALNRDFGDVMPLAVEMTKNKNLRETLAAAASDPELRELLADPQARDQIKRLTKKELREFLFNDAVSAYERYATPAQAAAANAVDPRDARIAELEGRFEEDRNTRESAGYIGGRQRELRALVNEFPDLSKPEAQKQLAHVVEYAEDRFERAAMQAGIKTRNADGTIRQAFTAEALRKGIRPPSYREAHQYYAEVLGRAAPPAAPATSPATPPGPAQAPRTSAEGKQRGLELLKNNGGFNKLAASARRK